MLVKKKKKVLEKIATTFRPLVLSRHPSHDILRTNLERLPFRSVVRLGSTTVKGTHTRIECNSVNSVKNSSDKLLMKQCFTSGGCKTAQWFTYNPLQVGTSKFVEHTNKKDILTHIDHLPYPLIAKHRLGSRGTGNSMIDNPNKLKAFLANKEASNYIFEKYYTFSKEYRLHITEDGCFYACRKMLKKDTPKEERFQRHADNSVWILEENKDFDKPHNWNEIVKDCVKALKSLGGDIMGFDIKTQLNTDSKGKKREKIDYIIIESNSACSFGTITAQKYLVEIPKVLKRKYAH